MKLKVRTKTKAEIPTASMPDVIFMLLVFFMVTTVLREYEGLPIVLPSAVKIEKLESRRNTAHVFVNKVGLVSIDDKRIPISSVRNVMGAKLMENIKIIVSLKADRDTPMKIITDVHQEFRHAQTLKVNYAAKTRVL